MARPEPEATQVEKRGKNWTLRVQPADRLMASGESFPQQTVHIDLEQPLKDPNTKQDMGVAKISGWVLAPYEPHTGFVVSDFWQKAKQPLEMVYTANWMRYMLVGSHGKPEDFPAIGPGFQFSIKHSRFQGEVVALSPRAVEEHNKKFSDAQIDLDDYQSHCRFTVKFSDENGKVRQMEYILKNDVITDPRYLAFVISVRHGENAPQLTEASRLWRENGGKWQKGQNAFEVFLGRL